MSASFKEALVDGHKTSASQFLIGHFGKNETRSLWQKKFVMKEKAQQSVDLFRAFGQERIDK